MDKVKINSYTDESGQDTKGKTFIVCTVIVLPEYLDEIENKLVEIEQESGKIKKWYHSGNRRRHKYIKLLLEKKIVNNLYIYYSEYKNKQDYISLISSHIAKTIIIFTGDREYVSKIFIDKMDKKTMFNLAREIKLFKIRYKKIKGIPEENSAFIRLSDTLCGMLRDMNNKNIPNNYKTLFSKLQKI